MYCRVVVPSPDPSDNAGPVVNNLYAFRQLPFVLEPARCLSD